MDTKRCSTCGETKPLEQFHRMRASRDGHMSICMDCNKTRVRRWRDENREYIHATGAAQMRRWRAARKAAQS